MINIEGLYRDGFCVVPQVFSPEFIQVMRQRIRENFQMMRNTRPNPNSRHLAGFHRFSGLSDLHQMLLEHERVVEVMERVFDGAAFGAIGLSDITVNRSQNWHTDLLRGPYAEQLSPQTCWGDPAPTCVKALIYLQDSASLQVVPGSHLKEVDLSDDQSVIPDGSSNVQTVKVRSGDLVLIDLRLAHRGSSERDLAGMQLGEDAKMMVSTVFGAADAPLSVAMRDGNLKRLADWDRRHPAQELVQDGA